MDSRNSPLPQEGSTATRVHEVRFRSVPGQIQDQICYPGTGVDDTVLRNVRDRCALHSVPICRCQRLGPAHTLNIVEFQVGNVSESLRLCETLERPATYLPIYSTARERNSFMR